MNTDITSDKYITFMRERIRSLMDKNKISGYALSYGLGMNKGYIGKIINGNSLPSTPELMNICLYFDIEPCDFFDPNVDLDNVPALYETYQKLKRLNPPDFKMVTDQINRFLKD